MSSGIRVAIAVAIWLVLAPLASARAENFNCICLQERCGNGAMPGKRGEVRRGIVSSFVERLYGPSRTGDEQTGWSCVPNGTSLPDVPAPPPPAQESAPAATTPTAPVDQSRYVCICSKPSCGGIGVIEGKQGDRHAGLRRTQAKKLYLADESSGWKCESESGTEPATALVAGPDSPASTASASTDRESPRDPARARRSASERYACRCTRATCGGEGLIDGVQGQNHSGIPAARVESLYGPSRSGSASTGWVCQGEPTTAMSRYTCTCERPTCGGGGLLEAERGQRHQGIPESRVDVQYGPARKGDEASGWVCQRERAPTPLHVRQPGHAEDEVSAEPPARAGIVSLDAAGGGSFAIGGTLNTAVLALKLGIAVTANRLGYLILPAFVQPTRGSVLVAAGFGFQYDIPISGHWYFTPRVSLGYAASMLSAAGPGAPASTAHLGHFTTEAGVKYVWKGRLNLGFDLFSLPIFFNSAGSSAAYRALALIGVNF